MTLLQQLVNGIVLGGLLAFITLGYTMVYGIIQLINFAHGEVFMVGSYAALATYLWALPSGIQSTWYLALPIVILAGAAFSVLVAVIMERFAYRPLRNAPRLAPLITALGISVFLQEAVRNFFPDGTRPKAFPEVFPEGQLTFLGVTVPASGLLLVVMAIILTGALQLYVNTSKLGRAMRATAQDPDTARLMGINPDRVIVLTFILGAALAGVGGVLYGVHYDNINITIGFQNGIFAFTAAVLGGIGSLRGAVVGAFCIGLIKTLAGQYMPGGTAYDYVWIFVILILVLVFRPQGFFGETERVRA
ncbi:MULTISPECIES: branched-chain amino acid ABC transporter permease [Actinokineospora]|uniref:branched-chain amino acid ABC transporter permease n=1 Tax=Actinokineospora TaxID=39845 RepID=UPI001E430381|nr:MULTISPECIES: branched-chain amino acid ABC transporter permease [Actinokineospora]